MRNFRRVVVKDTELRKRVFKPSSVSPGLRGGRSFLWPQHCCWGLATYPGASSGPLSNAPLFGLAPGGVCHASPVTRAAVSSYLAFSPLPNGIDLSAVSRSGIFSVALSLESPPVAVSDHPALWSSDFPPASSRRSPDSLPHSQSQKIKFPKIKFKPFIQKIQILFGGRHFLFWIFDLLEYLPV